MDKTLPFPSKYSNAAGFFEVLATFWAWNVSYISICANVGAQMTPFRPVGLHLIYKQENRCIKNCHLYPNYPTYQHYSKIKKNQTRFLCGKKHIIEISRCSIDHLSCLTTYIFYMHIAEISGDSKTRNAYIYCTT